MRTFIACVACLTSLATTTTLAGECGDFRAGHKNVYYGDLHTHTSYSLDAYFFNALTDPRKAHQYAKGAAALPLPAKGSEAIFDVGQEIRIDRPLDFNAVTDHAEFLGGMHYMCDNSAQTQQGCDQAIGAGVRRDIRQIAAGNTPFATQQLQAAITVSPTSKLAWATTQQMNDEEYEPCTYTTLHAYEYTSNEQSQMFHRNVIFNGPAGSLPTDVFGAVKPYSAALPENANEEWELFDHLQTQCREELGCQVLTIPHNPNLSDGRMFLEGGEDSGVTLTEPLEGRPLGRKIEQSDLFQPMTVADAELRRRYDRSIEMTQHKGSSECAIGLEGEYLESDEGYDPKCDFELFKSVCTGDDDEPASCKLACSGDPMTDPPFCFNRNRESNLSPICERTGPDGLSGGDDRVTDNCVHPLDYYRNAMAEGLSIRQHLGVNPYRVNISASLDTHNGDSGNSREKDFIGHGGVLDDDPDELLGFWDCNGPAQNAVEQRLNPASYNPASTDPGECPGRDFYNFARVLNPGGVTGVWAAENTRDEIFAAIHRGESFGTSGPRLRVRSVASWQPLPEDICTQLASGRDLVGEDILPQAARMGGQLPPPPEPAAKPYVAVWAIQDPEGYPLQRIDLIKGYVNAEGEPKVRVFAEVAATNAEVARPDPLSCAVAVSGRARFPGDGRDTFPPGARRPVVDHPGELCAVWQDQDFDTERDAFWYARVLEVPSCRWSAHMCMNIEVAGSSEPQIADCSQLDPGNGMFPEASGFKGYEGCCVISGEPGSFRGSRRFDTIEERAWASPIWYEH